MLTAATWTALPACEELALLALPESAKRLLIVPALFGEANKMRRFTVETMRALASHGIGSILPDLPGTNESTKPLSAQTVDGWAIAMENAVQTFAPSHVVAVRGGAVCAPAHLPTLAYAPQDGASITRAMLRLQMISEREAGRDITRQGLEDQATSTGLTIAGFHVTSALYNGLATAKPVAAQRIVTAQDLGGPGLWLRAEPSEAPDQSKRLAQIIAEWVK